MDAEQRIKQKLKKLEVDPNTLKKNIIRYLVTIDELLEQKRNRRADLIKELEGCNYTVKSVALETGISRTTFYSYDGLLQKFVELSHEEDYKEDPYIQIQALRKSIRDLQEEVTLMEKRDCQELKLKAENKRLSKLISDRDKTIERLMFSAARKNT